MLISSTKVDTILHLRVLIIFMIIPENATKNSEADSEYDLSRGYARSLRGYAKSRRCPRARTFDFNGNILAAVKHLRFNFVRPLSLLFA
jgi:hypothetical protein